MPTHTVGSGKTHATLQSAINAVNAIGNLAGTGVHRILVDGNYDAGVITSNLTVTGVSESDCIEFDCVDPQSLFAVTSNITFVPPARTRISRGWIMPSASHASTDLIGYGGDTLRTSVAIANCRFTNPAARNCSAVEAGAEWMLWDFTDTRIAGFNGAWKYAIHGAGSVARTTVHDCFYGLEACGTVINTVVTDTSQPCFSAIGTMSYCASSDATATGTGSITSLDAVTAFVDPDAGDFTLNAGSPLIGAGVGGINIGADQVTGQEVAPAVNVHPTGGTVIEGDHASFKVFTVEFSGVPAPAIQWWRKNAGDDDGDATSISGATSATLIIYGDDVTADDDNTDLFRAEGENQVGQVFTNWAPLSVILAPFTIVSGPTAVQPGGEYTFRVSGTNSVPTVGNTSVYYAGAALTVVSVTAVGGGVYDIIVSVPVNLALQYSASVNGWTINVAGHVAMPWETSFLPPAGSAYAVLLTPDLSGDDTLLDGYTGGAPAAGDQIEIITPAGAPAEPATVVDSAAWTAPDGIPVTVDSSAIWTLHGAITRTQWIDRRVRQIDGTIGDTAPFYFNTNDVVPSAFSLGADVTGAEPGATTDRSVTPEDIDEGADVTATVTNGTVSVDGGAHSASATFQFGQTLTVRGTAPAFGQSLAVTLNISGITDSFSIASRAASVPSIIAHLTGKTATEGETVIFTVEANGANGTPPYQFVENVGGEEFTLAGENEDQLTIANVQLSDHGRGFAVYVRTSEGGVVRSPSSGFAPLTVVANETRITIPGGTRDAAGNLNAGRTNVPVDIHSVVDGKVGGVVHSTTINFADSGDTYLDSDQLGPVGTVRAVGFPSSVGGVSTSFHQVTVGAIS